MIDYTHQLSCCEFARLAARGPLHDFAMQIADSFIETEHYSANVCSDCVPWANDVVDAVKRALDRTILEVIDNFAEQINFGPAPRGLFGGYDGNALN